MNQQYIYIKEVQIEQGLQYRAIMANTDNDKELILRDGLGFGIFSTIKQAEAVGEFWSERKKVSFEHYSEKLEGEGEDGKDS